MKKILATTVMASGDPGFGIPWSTPGLHRLPGKVVSFSRNVGAFAQSTGWGALITSLGISINFKNLSKVSRSLIYLGW